MMSMSCEITSSHKTNRNELQFHSIKKRKYKRKTHCFNIALIQSLKKVKTTSATWPMGDFVIGNFINSAISPTPLKMFFLNL